RRPPPPTLEILIVACRTGCPSSVTTRPVMTPVARWAKALTVHSAINKREPKRRRDGETERRRDGEQHTLFLSLSLSLPLSFPPSPHLFISALSFSFVILLLGKVQDQRYLMPGISGNCDRLLCTRNFDRRACGCIECLQTNFISALRQPLDH